MVDKSGSCLSMTPTAKVRVLALPQHPHCVTGDLGDVDMWRLDYYLMSSILILKMRPVEIQLA